MRALFLFVAVVASAVISIATASAAASAVPDLTRADRALAGGYYTAAYRQYTKAATHDPLAQFDLGLMAHEGWGRPRDPVLACDWFDKAAHGKVPAAEQLLGDCLAHGTGRVADGDAAVQWYSRAAESGIAAAWCSAGELYIEGRLVERNVERGMTLCQRAAQAGSPLAMRRLGDHYREGAAGTRDLAMARYWYRQAAQWQDPEAEYRLGLMTNQGDGGPADAPLALSWLESAASQGYAPAYLPVAILYANQAPDPETGRLAPDTLARIYMWDRVAQATALTSDERAVALRIERLSLAAMPRPWQADLDRRVAAHLAKFAPQRDSG